MNLTLNQLQLCIFNLFSGIPLAIASSTLAYGLLVKPFPTCYLQGVGEYSCFTNHGEEAIAQQSVDPEPNNQLIEKCWLSINNYLVLALFVPAVIVLVVSVLSSQVSLGSERGLDRANLLSVANNKASKISTNFKVILFNVKSKAFKPDSVAAWDEKKNGPSAFALD